MRAEQRVDPVESQRPAADDRKRIGQGITRPPRRAPQGRRALQEVDIGGGVDGEDRRQALVAGQLGRGKRRPDRLGPRRHLGIGGEAAIVQLLAGGMGELARVEEGAHAGLLTRIGGARSV